MPPLAGSLSDWGLSDWGLSDWGLSEQGLEVRGEAGGLHGAPDDLPLSFGSIEGQDGVLLHGSKRPDHGVAPIRRPVAYPDPPPEETPALLDRTQRTIEPRRTHLEGVGAGYRVLQVEQRRESLVHPFAIGQSYRIVCALDDNPYPLPGSGSFDLDPCQLSLSTLRRSSRQSFDVRREIVARPVKVLRVRFFLRNA